MKRFLAVLSAVILALMCICVPVKAHSLDDKSTYIKSGQKVKFTLKDVHGKATDKVFKFTLSKEGRLNAKFTIEAGWACCFLYDENGTQITNHLPEIWSEPDKRWTYGLQAKPNSAGIISLSFDDYWLDKGTYYLQFVRMSEVGKGSCIFEITYPSDKTKTKESVSLPSVVLKKGQTVALGAIVANSPKTDISLSTSDKSVAKVDSDGVVTGVKKGTAVITVKAGKNSYKLGIIVE